MPWLCVQRAWYANCAVQRAHGEPWPKYHQPPRETRGRVQERSPYARRAQPQVLLQAARADECVLSMHGMLRDPLSTAPQGASLFVASRARATECVECDECAHQHQAAPWTPCGVLEPRNMWSHFGPKARHLPAAAACASMHASLPPVQACGLRGCAVVCWHAWLRVRHMACGVGVPVWCHPQPSQHEQQTCRVSRFGCICVLQPSSRLSPVIWWRQPSPTQSTVLQTTDPGRFPGLGAITGPNSGLLPACGLPPG